MVSQRRHTRRSRKGRVFWAGRKGVRAKKVGKNYLLTKFTRIGPFFRTVSRKQFALIGRKAKI